MSTGRIRRLPPSLETIEKLHEEIHQIDSMLKDNEEKQDRLRQFIRQSREKRLSDQSNELSSSSTISISDEHCRGNLNNNARCDCSSLPISDHHHHHFRAISFADSTHLFSALPSLMTSSTSSEDYSSPVVMQGHISHQAVTVLNRSAAQLILRLKSLRAKR